MNQCKINTSNQARKYRWVGVGAEGFPEKARSIGMMSIKINV